MSHTEHLHERIYALDTPGRHVQAELLGWLIARYPDAVAAALDAIESRHHVAQP